MLLFVDRAQHQQPEFALTEALAPVVARLCNRLDGIPFALELAAALVPVYSLDQIIVRLDNRFNLLIDGKSHGFAATADVACNARLEPRLLSETERRVLRRISLFLGGFTLGGAAAVAVDETINESADGVYFRNWLHARWSSPTRPIPRHVTDCWKPSARMGAKSWTTRARPPQCSAVTHITSAPNSKARSMTGCAFPNRTGAPATCRKSITSAHGARLVTRCRRRCGDRRRPRGRFGTVVDIALALRRGSTATRGCCGAGPAGHIEVGPSASPPAGRGWVRCWSQLHRRKRWRPSNTRSVSTKSWAIRWDLPIRKCGSAVPRDGHVGSVRIGHCCTRRGVARIETTRGCPRCSASTSPILDSLKDVRCTIHSVRERITERALSLYREAGSKLAGWRPHCTTSPT